MCGSHDHDHDPKRPIFRPRLRAAPGLRSRRAFLGEVGRSTVAMAVVAPLVAACGSDDEAGDTGDDGDDATATTGTSETADGGAADGASSDAGDSSEEAGSDLRWARANLGFVSAYVLARGNTAAIVDTGTAGSAEAIGETLGTIGLTYDDVDHVILTHHHGDHVGSIDEVLAMAGSATVYAGEADLEQIDVVGADITGLVGGEDIFGFETLATPGHTAGHMAVIDHAAGLLVAGDAIFTDGGGVVEGPERFFDDVAGNRDTIRELAALSFNTLLVGHGDPIEAAADTAVAALAASL